VDDVINPSGHRIGTAEVESALVACEQVSEAAVVGFPHEVKGEGIGCFVILREGYVGDAELVVILKQAVRTAIGPIATPDFIIFSDLPKVRNVSCLSRYLLMRLLNILLTDTIWKDYEKNFEKSGPWRRRFHW
jgi:acetyl-CoA synthetase